MKRNYAAKNRGGIEQTKMSYLVDYYFGLDHLINSEIGLSERLKPCEKKPNVSRM